MSVNCGVGKTSLQLVNQLFQGMALLLGSCVVRLAVHVQATYVADANAVGVMPLAVGSRLFYLATCFYRTVQQHHIVVAYHGVALFAVPAVYVAGSEMSALLSGRAMDDYFCYCSHGYFFKDKSQMTKDEWQKSKEYRVYRK